MTVHLTELRLEKQLEVSTMMLCTTNKLQLRLIAGADRGSRSEANRGSQSGANRGSQSGATGSERGTWYVMWFYKLKKCLMRRCTV